MDGCGSWATSGHRKRIEIKTRGLPLLIAWCLRARGQGFDLDETAKEWEKRERANRFVNLCCLKRVDFKNSKNRFSCNRIALVQFLVMNRIWKFFEWWRIFQVRPVTSFPSQSQPTVVLVSEFRFYSFLFRVLLGSRNLKIVQVKFSTWT